MNAFEQQEFWAALNRLYSSAQALQASTEALRDIAQAHESRLDRLEVIQEWLAEKERKREEGLQ